MTPFLDTQLNFVLVFCFLRIRSVIGSALAQRERERERERDVNVRKPTSVFLHVNWCLRWQLIIRNSQEREPYELTRLSSVQKNLSL